MKLNLPALAFTAVMAVFATAMPATQALAQFGPAPNPAAPQMASYTVSNVGSVPVELYWDSGQGERLYTTIEPGKSYTQQTYVGHRWVIRLSDGSLLARDTIGSIAQGRSVAANPQPMAQSLDPTGVWRAESNPQEKLYLRLLNAKTLELSNDAGYKIYYLAKEGTPNTYVAAKLYHGLQDISPEGLDKWSIVVNSRDKVTQHDGNTGNSFVANRTDEALPPEPITQ